MKTYINSEGFKCFLMGYGKVSVPMNTIAVIKGDGNYSTILKTNGEQMMSAFTMRLFANHLIQYKHFFSPRKGLMLNLKEIERIDNLDGVLVAVMKNGEEHTLSRRKGKKMVEYLKENKFKIKLNVN